MSYFARIKAFAKYALTAGLRARALRGDIVFATSTPLTVIIPAWVAKAFRRIPIVFEVRDLWPELPIAVGALRNPVMKWGAGVLERMAYRSSTQIVALSPGMKEGVVRTGIDERDVTVITNSSDLDLFDVAGNESNPWLAAHPELAERRLVVYCGTLGRINGVAYLAEVAAHVAESHPGLAFVVVGDGTEREAINERARQLGVLRHNFFMIAPVVKSMVPHVLAAATITTSLFLPLREMEANSANKFFDGLAAARPIAINYGGWQKDLIESHEVGIALDPHDYAAAATQIVSLVGDDSLCARLGGNARDLAAREFSRDRAATRLLEVLKQAMKS